MLLDRRMLLAGSLALPALVTGGRTALARAPAAGTQVPGLYRSKVGDFEITAINDGMLGLDLALYASADKEEAVRLLGSAFLPVPVPTAVNAYLVNTGERLVLIDAGTIAGFAPTLGRLPANLRAAGIEPGAIDLVILTHLHADHVGALTDASGAAAFPNAELAVAEAEHAFWMDDGMLTRAPAEMKPFFAAARAALKPYAAAGRVHRFQPNTEIAPGVRVEAAPGHTPGHTMVRVGIVPQSLLVWGDVIHTAALQFARPEWAIGFDVDQTQAIETRRRVLDQAASERSLVAGMHLAFPGVGHVRREGQAYAFVPSFWLPEY
jgi:glyoxylase-like metal-dependent hydrolase (beta-lactamase superfamily II)